MKKQERIFLAINDIDEELLVESDSAKKPVYKVTIAACACVLLIIGAVLAIGLSRTPSDISGYLSTSEKYSSLDELLADMSHGEDHTRDSEGSTYGADTTGAAVYNGYSYHLVSGGIAISKLENNGARSVGRIDGSYCGVSVFGEYLALFSVDGGWETGEAITTTVKLFSLSDPASPILFDIYELGGSLKTVFCHNGSLFIAHGDGVCACGWSRLDSDDEYKPSITVNGNSITISGSDIDILGSPVRVEYTAITCIGGNGEYASTRVMYGNIEDIYVFEDELIFNVVEANDTKSSPPVLYRYELQEQSISYCGCVYLADALEISRDGTGYRLSGAYAELTNISKSDGVLRLVGVVHGFKLNEIASSRLFCISVSTDNESDTALSTACVNGKPLAIDELLCTDEHLVFTSSVYSDDGMSKNAYLSYIEVSGFSAQFCEKYIEVAYINGIDGYVTMGRPYGSVVTLIELDNNRLMRICSDFDHFELIELGKDDIELGGTVQTLGEDEVYMLEAYTLADGISAVLIGTPYYNGESYKFFSDKASYRLMLINGQGESLCSIDTQLDCSISIIESDGCYYLFDGESATPRILPIG